MVKTFDAPEISDITVDKLALNSGDFSGDLISGGTITNFSSTGINDRATKTTLIVEDDRIFVKHISVESIDNNLKIRGDVQIYGTLNVGLLKASEILANNKLEKQFLEFANPDSDSIGSGLLWSTSEGNKQFVYRPSPDRFWSTENIDIPSDRSYLINGLPVISEQELGRGITKSNIKSLGTLENLTVSGRVDFGDFVTVNPVSQRVSIGTEDANGALTIYDYTNDVELILDSNSDGLGLIGTFNTKGLGIVTDNQIRITVDVGGDVTVGHEQKDSTVTRVYGKLSVGVKNPREQFEVAGDMRVGNRLFSQGNSTPTSGNYQKGDIIWNTDPKEGSYIGWVCTAGGTPGLWKPFGMIGA
jgi:hypothetical protein